MTRKQALTAIRAAGSQKDQQTFLRLYTENRISFGAAKEAFDMGRRLARQTAESVWFPGTEGTHFAGLPLRSPE